MADHSAPRLEMRGLLFIFWAYVFILFDFRINGFDLLPDIVGFLLIVYGLTGLKRYTMAFAAAQKYAIVMTLLSVADVMILYATDDVMTVLLALLQTVFSVIMVMNICLGISQLAQNVGLTGLAVSARTRSTVYIIVTIASVLLTVVGTFLPGLAGILLVPTLLCSIAATALLMALFWQAERQLDGKEYFPIEKTEG